MTTSDTLAPVIDAGSEVRFSRRAATAYLAGGLCTGFLAGVVAIAGKSPFEGIAAFGLVCIATMYGFLAGKRWTR